MQSSPRVAKPTRQFPLLNASVGYALELQLNQSLLTVLGAADSDGSGFLELRVYLARYS